MPRNSRQEVFADVEVPEGLLDSADVALKPCAVCGESSAKRIYLQAHFPVVRCRGCGLVYADEHFKPEELARFYTGDYYERAYVCHPPQIDTKIAADYVREFRRIDALTPGGGRVLDFGSARGTFLGALADGDLGERWERDGVDINPDEVAMGQELGIPVRVADVFSGDVDESAYEAVTAFSVLEHMQDPMGTLTALRRCLTDSGKLLLIVPNGQCLIIKLGLLASAIAGDRARAFTDNVFHEEHLYYFSPRTMRRALEATGFKTLQIGFQPSYLETHPPGAIVTIGATALRFASWATRRQTMLVAVAEKV